MALKSMLEALPTFLSPTTLLLLFLPLLLLAYTLYTSFLHPLASIPGPLICRLTDTWIWYLSYTGTEARALTRYHDKYGPVVRIGPRTISISDGKALAPIYSEKGGFLKAPCYENFDFEGHPTIFSALDPKHRAVRSKAVMPLFSTTNIRGNSHVLEECTSKFIDRLREAKETSLRSKKETGHPKPFNVLNLARCLAIDSICSYLYGKSYEGLSERGPKLSASEYVDSVVAFGRLFYLPNYLFGPAFSLYNYLYPSERGDASAQKIEDFTTSLVDVSVPATDKETATYQSRLLAAEISERETVIQMQDVIFAGTDSTGTNTANLLYNLAKHPQIYKRLQEEVNTAEKDDPNYNPHSLPYLDAILREGLRTAMANPTRFPRQVPPQGFTFTSSQNDKTYHFPAGTIVGLQPYTLHLNPSVFSDPHSFNPDRWLEENHPTAEMYRDYFPFGLGARQCIARNLATEELVLMLREVAKSGVLEGARAVGERYEIMEWFNARVIGERVEVEWE